jgi:hypothetical protein
MVSVFMYLCHAGCTIVELGWLSFGSFLCAVSAGWRRMALSVFNAVWSCSGELNLTPFGSFASVAVVG